MSMERRRNDFQKTSQLTRSVILKQSQTRLLERKVPLVSAKGVMTDLCGNPTRLIAVPDQSSQNLTGSYDPYATAAGGILCY